MPSQVIQPPVNFNRMGNIFVETLFLGGGISNCPDWQAEMVQLLDGLPYVLLNPRRDGFDLLDPKMSVAQIEWEHLHLRDANAILFWFPSETLCPITLFEYGYWLGRPQKRLFIGVHPDYQRRTDLRCRRG
jgi:hypothetical protein